MIQDYVSTTICQHLMNALHSSINDGPGPCGKHDPFFPKPEQLLTTDMPLLALQLRRAIYW